MFLATTFLKNVASPWSSIGSHSSSMSLTAWHSPLRRWDCEWGGGETWEDLSSPESLALDIPDPGEDGVEHEGHAMGIPRFLYFEGKFAWAWFPELPNPKLLLQQLQVCGRHYNCQPYYYWTGLSLLLLPMCSFCTDQQKKINYSAPLRDIELKFWGYAQLALT